jgi:hypothetical protein
MDSVLPHATVAEDTHGSITNKRSRRYTSELLSEPDYAEEGAHAVSKAPSLTDHHATLILEVSIWYTNPYRTIGRSDCLTVVTIGFCLRTSEQCRETNQD